MLNDLSNREKLWIVGLLFDDSNNQPNLFILIETGEVEKPIFENGKIIIFQANTLIKYLFEKYDIFFLKEELYSELDIVLNIPLLVKKIQTSQRDSKSVIIDSLNILFDINKEFYKRRKKNINVKIMFSFMNHITFEKEFAESYFKAQNIDRRHLVDSIYWHLGLLLANSKFI